MNGPDERLAIIARQIGRCQRCPLHKSRANTVPGEGPATWIMFLGEAPGAQEDLQGRPFVGSAGKFLDELLTEAGLARESVFVTNVIKCRPPSNRIPRAAEIAACRPHLEAQIAALRPRLICMMGAIAMRNAIGGGSIKQLRGRPQVKRGVVYFPVLHPAASLYNPELKDVLRSDFRTLGRIIKDGPEGLLDNLGAATGHRTLDDYAKPLKRPERRG